MLALVACGGLARDPLGESAAAGPTGGGGTDVDAAVDGPSVVGGDGPEAASCVLRTADFDRSCGSDSDCTEVGDGDGCEAPCAFACRQGGAINQSALTAYLDALARTSIDVAGARCMCITAGLPCCEDGVCNNGATCARDRRAAGCVESGSPCQVGQWCCSVDYACMDGVCIGELH